MTLEEKLKAKAWPLGEFDAPKFMRLDDALSICQEAVDEAKKENIKLIDEMIYNINDFDRSDATKDYFWQEKEAKHKTQVLKELKEKL